MIPIKMLSTVNIEDYHVSLLLIVLLTIGTLEVSFIDNQVVPLDIMLKFSITQKIITIQTYFIIRNFISLQIAESLMELMLIYDWKKNKNKKIKIK